MKGETVNIEYKLERANAFLNAMSNFTDKFVAKNYAINVAVSYTHLDVYKRQGEYSVMGILLFY